MYGLGVIEPGDLDPGDLGACAGIRTGEPCRGMELGGLLSHCTCVNLTDPGMLSELRQMVSDGTGLSLRSARVWTPSDEAALLLWADDHTGLHVDVRRWWASGYVSATDLLQRTGSGWAYPTGMGIMALADGAGCFQEGEHGLELGPGADRLPTLRPALERALSVIHGDPEESIAVHPPVTGEEGARAEPIYNIPHAPPEGVVMPPEEDGPRLQWIYWSLGGAAAAALCLRLARRSHG